MNILSKIHAFLFGESSTTSTNAQTKYHKPVAPDQLKPGTVRADGMVLAWSWKTKDGSQRERWVTQEHYDKIRARNRESQRRWINAKNKRNRESKAKETQQ